DGIRDRTVTGVQTCALPIYIVDDSIRGIVAETFVQHRKCLFAGRSFEPEPPFSAARIPPLALLFELLSEWNEFISAPILQMLFSTHRARPPFAQTHPFIRSDTKVIMSPDPMPSNPVF